MFFKSMSRGDKKDFFLGLLISNGFYRLLYGGLTHPKWILYYE